MVASFSFSGCAAVVLLHLLALLLAIVLTVAVNVSAVSTSAVAVTVIVTVMYPRSTHATTVVIAMNNLDMTRNIFSVKPGAHFALICGLQLPSREPTADAKRLVLVAGLLCCCCICWRRCRTSSHAVAVCSRSSGYIAPRSCSPSDP